MLIEQVLLDVTLRRGDEERRWLIAKWDLAWRCRYTEHRSVTFSSCRTEEIALEKMREWELEIEAAKADGWS